MAEIKIIQRKRKEIIEYYFRLTIFAGEKGMEKMETSKVDLNYCGEKIGKGIQEASDEGIVYNFLDTILTRTEAQERHTYTFSSGSWSQVIVMNLAPKFCKQIDLFE